MAARAPVIAVAFSPDDLPDRRLHGRCQVWAREDEGLGQRRFCAEPQPPDRDAAFLPNGRRALTASLDNTVCQWDLETGEEITRGVLKHPGPVTSMAVLPDGKQALTTCDDGRLRLWDLDKAAVIGEMAGGDEALHHVAVSGDGGRALTTNTVDRVVRLWDLQTRREITHPGRAGEAMLDLPPSGPGVECRFTPDGLEFSVGDDARIWEIGSDRER